MKQTNVKLYDELKLRYGALNEVAKEAKVSREWVRQVLKGEAYNADILKVAATILKQYKAKEREAQKYVDAVLAE